MKRNCLDILDVRCWPRPRQCALLKAHAAAWWDVLERFLFWGVCCHAWRWSTFKPGEGVTRGIELIFREMGEFDDVGMIVPEWHACSCSNYSRFGFITLKRILNFCWIPLTCSCCCSSCALAMGEMVPLTMRIYLVSVCCINWLQLPLSSTVVNASLLLLQ